jgi:hypothetical protein
MFMLRGWVRFTGIAITPIDNTQAVLSHSGDTRMVPMSVSKQRTHSVAGLEVLDVFAAVSMSVNRRASISPYLSPSLSLSLSLFLCVSLSSAHSLAVS